MTHVTRTTAATRIPLVAVISNDRGEDREAEPNPNGEETMADDTSKQEQARVDVGLAETASVFIEAGHFLLQSLSDLNNDEKITKESARVLDSLAAVVVSVFSAVRRADDFENGYSSCTRGLSRSDCLSVLRITGEIIERYTAGRDGIEDARALREEAANRPVALYAAPRVG